MPPHGKGSVSAGCSPAVRGVSETDLSWFRPHPRPSACSGPGPEEDTLLLSCHLLSAPEVVTCFPRQVRDVGTEMRGTLLSVCPACVRFLTGRDPRPTEITPLKHTAQWV